jgi:hypothetical protein
MTTAAIKITYQSIDGLRDTRSFKTIEGARKFAQRGVGEHPELGRGYAVSGDGIGKVTVASGCELGDLFPPRLSDAQVCADPLALPTDTETAQAFDGAEAAETIAEAPTAATELRTEPGDAPEPSAKPWTIGAMVKELLLDPNRYDYPFIVEAVRREFPTASTSTRSVASVAAGLRRDGQVFPMRRKPRKNA